MMVQQGEGGVAMKPRRNGARLFKNPPQPHMCIQDYIQGSWDPCYVNVLSWGKIAMPHRPTERVPVWGGMRVSPPRTEKPQCAVFAVMVNPEILRLNGKNGQDPQERSALIDLLLDFVETMNEGVVFTRCYAVLKDRDITGELKEVWMAVQVKRDREQETRLETWIDVQPPAPQYPQYEMTPEYSYQTRNEQVYQTGHIVTQQYHANVPPQISQDQYNYGERGRQQNPVQNQAQQNCPAYPTQQYQFQQLPRQLVPQYINSNIHPNVNPNFSNQSVVNSNVNPNIPGHYQQYIALQQQMVEQMQLENVMHAVRETHGDMQVQGQGQQPPMQLPHIQSMPQYEQSPPFSLQNSLQMNVLRLGRPHMGVTQKSNANNRQTNSSPSSSSPTHSKQLNSTTTRQAKETTGDKSPVKGFRLRILRDPGSSDKSNPGHVSPETTKSGVGNSDNHNKASQNVQVTDLDEELEARSDDARGSKTQDVRDAQNLEITKKDIRQQILKSSDDITVLETDIPLEGTEDKAPKQDLSSKPVKTQILVLTRNPTKSNNNDSKGNAKETKVAKNAIRLTKLDGQQIYDLESERIGGNKERETKYTEDLWNSGSDECGDKKLSENAGRNGFAQHNKQQKERPKKSQNMNNIIKNTLKIHPGTSNEDSKSHLNQANESNGKTIDNDEVYHGYAILRKGEQINQDDVMSEIAQMSIQDCQETTEANTNVNS